MQRHSIHQSQGSEVPSAVNQVLRSPGHPLDTQTRNFFEPRFGQDFSHVRVQTDAESTQALNARAYTMGHHIVFDVGQYQPHTRTGQTLMAHELAHVVQQQPILRRSPAETIPVELETRGPLWERATAPAPAFSERTPRTPPPASWQIRVMAATGESDSTRRHQRFLQLMNEAIAPDISRYPDLSFPVEFLPTHTDPVPGGVYFEPTFPGVPGQRRVLRAVTRQIRSGATSSSGTQSFIILGPAALHPDDGPAFTQRALNHEYIHVQQNLAGRFTQAPTCVGVWQGRQLHGNPNREVVAVSTTFARFFPEWADRTGADTADPPFFLIEDLALLAAFFRCADAAVQSEAIRRIADTVAARPTRRQSLGAIITDVRSRALPSFSSAGAQSALERLASAVSIPLAPDARLPSR
ncbi:MAG: DUF4157 domain-containing protein [Cyanobacteria bacterium P01_D01_bin.14]